MSQCIGGGGGGGCYVRFCFSLARRRRRKNILTTGGVNLHFKIAPELGKCLDYVIIFTKIFFQVNQLISPGDPRLFIKIPTLTKRKF